MIVRMTEAEFMRQNKRWHDEYYAYSIHITDGDAVYLYSVSLAEYLHTAPKEELAVEVIRLDGVDLKKAYKYIKEVFKRG